MKNLIFLALLPIVLSQEPRLGGIFDSISDKLKPVNPVVYIKKVDDRNDDRGDHDFCGRRNGMASVRVGEDCLQLVSTPFLSYTAATTFCATNGGTLWIPDLDDPFLYQVLFRKFPQLFSAAAHDVFIGINRAGGRFSGYRGEDLSRNPLILNGRNMAQACFSLHFDFGAFYIQGIPNCGTNQYAGDFVCQYRHSHRHN